MPSTDQTILVTGATGRQGGAVSARLLADGWKVRALTRDASSAKAKALKAAGAEVVEGDLDDPASLAAATAGAWGVYSVHAGSYEGGPYGHDLDHERRSAANLGEAAKAAGVRHVVHSSSIGVGTDLETQLPTLPRKAEAEAAWRDTGLSLTILRPGAFMENTFDSPRELQNGVHATALGPGTYEPLIAADDIGAIAAIAFADPEAHDGKAYLLAGDDLRQDEKAALIGRLAGRDVPYQQIDAEEIRKFSPSTANAMEVINRTRMEVDIEGLRKVHPSLLTFEQWMTGVGKPLVDAYFARLDRA